MGYTTINQETANSIRTIDDELSQRFIALDPKGYFLVRLDHSRKELIVEHYSNDIDELGRAIDPESGKPLACKGELKRTPINVYKGLTAKEIGIKLTEGEGPYPLTSLDHAMYLGRELQRAEGCLLNDSTYIQD